MTKLCFLIELLTFALIAYSYYRNNYDWDFFQNKFSKLSVITFVIFFRLRCTELRLAFGLYCQKTIGKVLKERSLSKDLMRRKLISTTSLTTPHNYLPVQMAA